MNFNLIQPIHKYGHHGMQIAGKVDIESIGVTHLKFEATGEIYRIEAYEMHEGHTDIWFADEPPLKVASLK